jgi:hypothetical protein
MASATITIAVSDAAAVPTAGPAIDLTLIPGSDSAVIATLREVQHGLAVANATLANGSPIRRPVDALRYMLEQVAANVE